MSKLPIKIESSKVNQNYNTLLQSIEKALPSKYTGGRPDYLLALQEVGDFVSSSRMLKTPLEPEDLIQLQDQYQKIPPKTLHRWLALRRLTIQFGVLEKILAEPVSIDNLCFIYTWTFTELLYQVHRYTRRPAIDTTHITVAWINLSAELERWLIRLEIQDRRDKHHQISANGGKALAQRKNLPELREEAQQLWQEYENDHPSAYQMEIAKYVFSVIKEKALLSKALRNEDNAPETIIKWCRPVSKKAISRKNRKMNRITASCGK